MTVTADTPLTTVALVKAYLSPQPGTISDQGLIERLVLGASKAFRSYLNRDLLTASYDEIRDGTGSSTMLFANYPVTAVSAVSVGLPLHRVALVLNIDYIWTKKAVKLLGGLRFPSGNATVRLEYTAGFDAIPDDIADAAAKVVALRYKQLQRLGQTSKTMGNETVNFDLAAFPNDVKITLQNYKKVIQVSS